MSLQKKVPFAFTIIVFLTYFTVCTRSGSTESTNSESIIEVITSVEHFNAVVESSGNRLLAFDLYADWCMPCESLGPILDDLAKEQSYRLSMYRVDTDKFPQISSAFGVTGIPFVVFVKNQRAVYALIGVQPKDSYLEIIDTYADSSNGQLEIQPGSQSYEGLRVQSIRPQHTDNNLTNPIYLIKQNDLYDINFFKLCFFKYLRIPTEKVSLTLQVKKHRGAVIYPLFLLH